MRCKILINNSLGHQICHHSFESTTNLYSHLSFCRSDEYEETIIQSFLTDSPTTSQYNSYFFYGSSLERLDNSYANLMTCFFFEGKYRILERCFFFRFQKTYFIKNGRRGERRYDEISKADSDGKE